MGPTKAVFRGGSRYFLTFIDDFHHKVWVYLLKHESEVFTEFKLLKAESKESIRKKIKYLRSDDGTEYTDSNFKRFCEEHGQIHFSIHRKLQQNDMIERMNMSLIERERCLLLNDDYQKVFMKKLLIWCDILSIGHHEFHWRGKVA